VAGAAARGAFALRDSAGMDALPVRRQRLDEVQTGPLGDLLRSVALGARLRDAEWMDGRPRIVPRHQLVQRTVAGLARGPAGDLGEDGLAVDRGSEGVDGVLVAGGTVGSRRLGVMLFPGGAGMAIRTGQRAVDGLLEGGGIDVVAIRAC